MSRGDDYEIRIKGELDKRWERSFAGLRLTSLEDGNTLLAGRLTDQAALHGVLSRIRDLGLPLLSVTCQPKEDRQEDDA